MPTPTAEVMMVHMKKGGLMIAYCLLMAACAGLAGADWEGRIGHFSLNDAQRELGQPESCVGLDQGGTACSWMVGKGKDWMDKLVLTFDANGQLTTVNRVHF
jgi:hypothetical protein